MTRRTLTTLQKLRVVMRYCRCPGVAEMGHACGKPLGSLDRVDFDHIGMLGLTGDNSLENFRPLCPECHAIKTNGRPATTAGSDQHRKAKAARLARDTAEFRRRILEQDRAPTAFLPIDHAERATRKRPWPSRKFPKRTRND